MWVADIEHIGGLLTENI